MPKDYGWRLDMGDAELKNREILLKAPNKQFIRETLVMPDGGTFDWAYVATPPSVLIVPVLPDGQLVMVNQYRYNLRRYVLEFPAGIMAEGETPEQAAERELTEETGFSLADGAKLQPLGTFYSLPSETDKQTHIFLARPVRNMGPAVRDSEIEKYFNMSMTIIPTSLVIERIGERVASTETITALLLSGIPEVLLVTRGQPGAGPGRGGGQHLAG